METLATVRHRAPQPCFEVHGGGTQEPANFRKIMDYCGHKAVGANWNSNPTDVKDGSVRVLVPDLARRQFLQRRGEYAHLHEFRLE